MKIYKGKMYWTVKDASKAWDVSTSHVRLLLKNNPMPGVERDDTGHFYIPQRSPKPKFKFVQRFKQPKTLWEKLHNDYQNGAILCDEIAAKICRRGKLLPKQVKDLLKNGKFTAEPQQTIELRDIIELHDAKAFISYCAQRKRGPVNPTIANTLTTDTCWERSKIAKIIFNFKNNIEDPNREMAEYLSTCAPFLDTHLIAIQLAIFAQCIYRDTTPFCIMAPYTEVIKRAIQLSQRNPEQLVITVRDLRKQAPLLPADF